MKIGIITQPLDINYGGLLQNYALQQVLSTLGHEVYTINRNNKPRLNVKYTIKQLIKKELGLPRDYLYWELIKIRKLCREFVRDNIKTTDIFTNQKGLLKIVDSYNFDAYVVGSDQVWRPCYSENIYNDFLDFCQNIKGVKRIAYAASFGVNDWEFSNEQTQKCGELLKLFNAVSVREDSAIDLCIFNFKVKAIQVLDPTLLLEKEEYVKLVETNKVLESAGDFFCYILDTNDKIENTLHNIANKLSLKEFHVEVRYINSLHKKGEVLDNYVIPSPIKWLRAFMDARMVVTDSFHGCVFSIIFNKPFWVIGNEGRGNARFDSLLKLFGLESRKVNINSLDSIDLNTPIDWDKVNTIKREWQAKSFTFIRNNL